MNIVFFGSSDFSIPVLSALTRSEHQIICIVTTPSRKKGRGQKESPTVVRSWAESKSIRAVTPEKINTPEFDQIISKLRPDCLVVASYGKMIPNRILNIPKHYSLNVHPSLLPKYRGAAPIAHQLLSGETKSGVTIARITEKLDAGEIIAQKAIDITPDDNGISLSIRLAKLGGELILKVLDQIKTKNIILKAQDDSKSSYAKKLTVEMGRIDWDATADKIENQIRALVPWPCGFTFWEGHRVKVLDASRGTQLIKQTQKPGTILTVDPKGIISVQTRQGVLFLRTLQPESGKAMNAYAFALGRYLKPGDKFS